MYYSPICFEKYADISLFPKNFPSKRLLNLSDSLEEQNKQLMTEIINRCSNKKDLTIDVIIFYQIESN